MARSVTWLFSPNSPAVSSLIPIHSMSKSAGLGLSTNQIAMLRLGHVPFHAGSKGNQNEPEPHFGSRSKSFFSTRFGRFALPPKPLIHMLRGKTGKLKTEADLNVTCERQSKSTFYSLCFPMFGVCLLELGSLASRTTKRTATIRGSPMFGQIPIFVRQSPKR